MMEMLGILEEDYSVGVVDEQVRRGWLDAHLAGAPTGRSPKLNCGQQAMSSEANKLPIAHIDKEDRRMSSEANLAGRPKSRAMAMIFAWLDGNTASHLVFQSNDWVHWGDSLTEHDWAVELGAMTGRSHSNQGVGGQVSSEIAARQGGAPARVILDGNNIPRTGSVNVTTIVRTPLSNQMVTNTGSIGGVHGTLSWTPPTLASHTFTRTDEGEPVTVGTMSVFVPDAAIANRNRIVTIWAGRNDHHYGTPEKVLPNIQAMIDYLSPTVKRAMVLEIPPSASEINGTASRAALDALNGLIKATFAPYWVPVATWLQSSDAMAAAGITFDSTDLTDIANGVTPKVFRSDPLHFNLTGRSAIAARVYDEAARKRWL
jgi:hypothetical protein